MQTSKVCVACDFRTLVIEAKRCARCGEDFVAKDEKPEDEPPIAKAAGKATAKKKKDAE